MSTLPKAERLLLRHLAPAPGERIVDLISTDLQLAIAVAGLLPGGKLLLLTHDAAVRTTVQPPLQEARVRNAEVVVAAGAGALPPASFDAAYLLTRPYLSTRELIALLEGARQCLKPGGRLLLMAAMRHGAPSILRHAEAIFGNLQVVDKPGGNRIVRCIRGAGAPADEQATTGEDTAAFAVEVRGHQFSFLTHPGLFGHGVLDSGTRLLLETVTFGDRDRVVDLGCGYGAIGIVAARLAASGRITLLDADARAVEVARANLVRNGITAAQVLLSDGFSAVPPRHQVELVLSNPPLHAPSGTLSRLTREAYAHLVTGGRLAYVVQRGYDARQAIHAAFGNVEVLAETEEYRVVSATRHQDQPEGFADLIVDAEVG